ncbi:MAG: PQQ-binding-like beta-propeller repeat protein [Rhodospirillales bacterium]|nr:PQQ-binding-like beta-propeller repeat protein [Rhodospirillales bacterium]
MARQWKAIVLAALLLSGCDTWFGEADAPPLPGERISVLEHQRALTADPRASTEPIVLPAPVLNASWPQAGGIATHSMQNVEAGGLNRPAWQVSIGTGTDDDRPILPPPVVADGRVFTIDALHVVSAFDTRTGKRLWSNDLAENEDDDDAEPGGIAFDDGKIYVATGFSKVIALDAFTGKRVWRRNVGLPMHAPPTVAGGLVFVVTVENELRALNSTDGSDAWPPYQGLAETARLVGGANSASDGSVVVAPFSSGEIVALRTDTGRPLWSESLAPARRTDELSSLAQIRARPVIDRARAYAISAGGVLAAFDMRSGQRLWDRDIGGTQSPWLAGHQLYQLTNDNLLVCIDADNGRIAWVTQLAEFEDEKDHSRPILWFGPVLAGERLLVVSSDGRFAAVSAADGRIVENRSLSDGFAVSPVVADGTVFLLSSDGDLSAYR